MKYGELIDRQAMADVPDTNVGDTISRQAAIDALWKALFKYEDDTEKQFQESDELDLGEWMVHRIFVQNMSDIDRQTILNLPSAQPEQKWIPCSERLPEVGGTYLVTRGSNVCGALWNRVYIINYSDLMGLKSERIWWDGNVGKSDFERIDDVLAWMPLPKPWKGEKDEQTKN